MASILASAALRSISTQRAPRTSLGLQAVSMSMRRPSTMLGGAVIGGELAHELGRLFFCQGGPVLDGAGFKEDHAKGR